MPTYTLLSIPSGAAGIRQTLIYMSDIVRKYRVTPEVRELALSLVANVPQKNWVAETNAIFEFVRDKIRYVKDINGCETLQSPIQTLRIGQGDCDDKSILSASLLESIGHPARFQAVGFSGKSFSHVFTEAKIGERWVPLECTMPWPLGKTPSKIKARMTQHIARK